MDRPLQLYTFAISHFSEKARWALDYEGVAYTEQRLLPGPHMLTTRRLAPRSSVPILRAGRRVIQGSSAILDYLRDEAGKTRLTSNDPTPERSLALEAEVDRAFGLGVQRIFYATLLSHRALVTDLWSQQGPGWARAFYTVAYPGVAAVTARMYKTRGEAVTRAKDRFRQTMDVLDRQLENQPYLGGEAPGRVDIGVAALLAPMCRPPEHSLRWPEPPGELLSFAQEFEGRPTYEHVLHMYRNYRRAA